MDHQEEEECTNNKTNNNNSDCEIVEDSQPSQSPRGGDKAKLRRLEDMSACALHTENGTREAKPAVAQTRDEEDTDMIRDDATTESEGVDEEGTTTAEPGDEEAGKADEEEEEEETSFIRKCEIEALHRSVGSDSEWTRTEGVPSVLTVPRVPEEEAADLNAEKLVVLVLDASTSMVTGDMQRYVVQMLRGLRKVRASVAVVAYNMRAQVLLAPRPAESVADDIIREVLRSYRGLVSGGTSILSALLLIKERLPEWKLEAYDRSACRTIEVDLVMCTDGEETGPMRYHFEALDHGMKKKHHHSEPECQDVCDWIRAERMLTTHVVGLGTPRTMEPAILRRLGGLSLAEGTFHVVLPVHLVLVAERIVEHFANRGPLAHVRITESMVASDGVDWAEKPAQAFFRWLSLREDTRILFAATPGTRVDATVKVYVPSYRLERADGRGQATVDLWRAVVFSMERIEISEKGSSEINDEVALLFMERYIKDVYFQGKTDQYFCKAASGETGGVGFLNTIRRLLDTTVEVCSKSYGESRACRRVLDDFCAEEAAFLAEKKYACDQAADARAAIERDFEFSLHQSQGSLDLLHTQASVIREIHLSQSGFEFNGEEEADTRGAAGSSAVPLIEPPAPSYQIEDGTFDLRAYEEMVAPSLPDRCRDDDSLTKDADADFDNSATTAGSGGGGVQSQTMTTDVMTGETAVGASRV